MVVADDVLQREAVVRGDVLHGGPRLAAGMVEHVARTGQAVRHARHLAGVAAPERAGGVAEPVVPVAPAGGEGADAVAAVAEVPGFRDQLDAPQHRILPDRLEEGGALRHLEGGAGEGRRQVEAEPVDVVGLDPVAQAVQHQLQHARVRQVERVAAAGAIPIEARVIRHQLVIRLVVRAAERQRRPGVVALAGVVVDDVEDHLDAGGMQRLHRRAQAGGAVGAEVARLGREIVERRVAPIVAQALLHEETVVGERLDGQQLHGGDADLDEVVDDRRVAERGVGAAHGAGQVGVQLAQPLEVGLVDDRVAPRHVGAAVVAPGPRRVLHHALRHHRRAVAPVRRRVGAVAARAKAIQRVVPADLAGELAGVRIQQQLVGVEAVAGARLVGSVHTVPVCLSGSRVGDVAVPNLIGAARQGEALGFRTALPIEQTQVDSGRVRREQGEVHSPAVPGRAERRGVAFAQGMGQTVSARSSLSRPGPSSSATLPLSPPLCLSTPPC